MAARTRTPTFTRTELVSGFLKSRRARLLPEPGSPASLEWTHRKVPGLRREELAWAAGISVDYYTKLEQGRASHPSEAVITAICVALHLSPLDQAFLRQLFTEPKRLEPPASERIRAVRDLTTLSASLPDAVMLHILDRTLWLRALEPTTRLLMFGDTDNAPSEIHLVDYVFTHPRARRLYVDWEVKAAEVVGMLQLALSDERDHDALVPVAQRLWSTSARFRELWQNFDIHTKGSGVRRIGMPDGSIRSLRYITVAAPYDDTTKLVAYLPDEAAASPEGSDDADSQARTRDDPPKAS